MAFFCQLCASTIDVCTSTYLLTTANVTTTKYWTMVFSLSGIMLQICLYCWPGNVVMEKVNISNYLKKIFFSEMYLIFNIIIK